MMIHTSHAAAIVDTVVTDIPIFIITTSLITTATATINILDYYSIDAASSFRRFLRFCGLSIPTNSHIAFGNTVHILKQSISFK
jgi:hypothetical protein